MKYYKNFDLIKYNSFHLKSIAQEIWFPTNIVELSSILKYRPFNILSCGTNVLLAPKIKKIICLRKMPQKIIYYGCGNFVVDANASASKFIKETIKYNYSGTEGLLGIPGTIGAAIIGNSGNGKYAFSDYLVAVRTMSPNGKIKTYFKKNLRLDRRYTILQDKNEIILYAVFKFNKKIPKKEEITKTLLYRKQFPKGYCAGGFFKNWYSLKPYEKEIREIKSPNLYISKQLNVIINKGNATFSEVILFINKIKQIVKEPLELEVKIIK